MRATTECPARRQDTHHRSFSAIAYPAVVSAARDFAADCLAAWGVAGDRADTVVLVVSELVTNAVLAATGFAITVDLRHVEGAHLVVEVWDPVADGTPVVREAGPDHESGRGLFMVSALAERWDVRSEHGGKTVCAVIA